MAVIEARGLSKAYRSAVKEPGLGGAVKHLFKPVHREVVAVSDVNLSIEAGETVAYVGPNGAGKSTTIKMLTGILMPSTGQVRVNGLDPYRHRMESTKRIGVVFGQRTQLWWDIPVTESFTLIRDIYNVPAARYADNLAYLSEMLGLKEFMDMSARKLSLGQRMRADLAVSFLHDPAVVFLDEPTIGLDVAVRERIRQFLGKVNRERGVTVLLTSHDLDDIRDVCKRLVIIDKGTIIYDGQLQDLLDRTIKSRTMHLRLVSGGPALARSLASHADIEVIACSEHELSLDFDRFALSARDVITLALRDGEVVDFRIDEPDIERVVKSVYQGRLELDPDGAPGQGSPA
jgi:ABC-2 type transport system ATP-binding protein